jgi:FAD/FMN-containing dehydrogenase
VKDALRAQLAAIVGKSGIGVNDVVQPADMAQLRAVLGACSVAEVAAAPAGSADGGDATVLIGDERLDAIRIEAAALLLHAGAGSTWAAVRKKAAAKKLAVSGLPPTRSDHVGESTALGELARRSVAGVDLLTGAGELISAGGRTLKDVVGYDVAGLALGSGTRLGLVMGVTLRLEPAAAGTPAQPGAGPWRGDGGLDVAAAFASLPAPAQVVSPTSD